MTFTSFISRLLAKFPRRSIELRWRLRIHSTERVLCGQPRGMDRLGALDDSVVACSPSQLVVRLLRGDELVLIEPSADVVSLHRSLAADIARVARRSNAS